MADNPLLMALSQSLPRLAERRRVERKKEEQIELGKSVQSIFKSPTTSIQKNRDLAELFASKGHLKESIALNQRANDLKKEEDTLKKTLDRQEGLDYIKAVKDMGLKLTTKGFVNAWQSGVFDPDKVGNSELVVNTKDGGKVFKSSGYVLNEKGERVYTEGIQVYKPGSDTPTYTPQRDNQGRIVEGKEPFSFEQRRALVGERSEKKIEEIEKKSEVAMKEFWEKEGASVSEDFFNKYKKGINADRNESISILTEINQSIEKAPNNPATYGIITSIIARQLGKEVGALSEGDLKRVSGDQAVPSRIKRYWGKMLKGKALTDDDLDDFKEFINTSVNIQSRLIDNDIESFSQGRELETKGELDSEFIKSNLSGQLDFSIEPKETTGSKLEVGQSADLGGGITIRRVK